jgi:hypothetical protein
MTTLTITDRVMRSPYTRHTATAWPVPGEPTLWAVTWLPGRNLTQTQAQAAMHIAETVGRIPADAQPETWTKGVREHLDTWAAAIGLSAPDAVAWVTDPEPEAGHDHEPGTRPPDPEAAD